MDPIIAYHQAVERFVLLAGAPPMLLQVHAGMAIYLGCLVLMGTRRGSLAAVLVVVTLAMFHEAMSALASGAWLWHEAIRDILLALFWPTICYAVSSYRRWSWAESLRQRSNDRLLHLYDYRPERAARRSAPAAAVARARRR